MNYVGGIATMLVGVGFGVAAFFVPEGRPTFIILCPVMLATGGFILWIGRWVNNLTKGFPQAKGFGPSMRDAADKMAGAAAMLEQQTRADRLRMTGKDAKAQVLAMRDTGMLINHDPVIEFDLLVTLDERPPYPLMGFRQLVSKLMVGRIVPGQSYPAKVDLDDPQQILLSWI
jgi:hypothetical protein